MTRDNLQNAFKLAAEAGEFEVAFEMMDAAGVFICMDCYEYFTPEPNFINDPSCTDCNKVRKETVARRITNGASWS